LNPCSMGLWCVKGGTAFRIREFYHDGRKSGRQMTDEEYYKELKKLAGNLSISYIVIDPSAASFIETIRRHGRFLVKKAKNDVIDGIRFTAGLLSDEKIKIHPDCRAILAEFTAYRWDEQSENDRPIKQNDHAMDDLRYFCYTILKKIW
nr:PBSX family phage terminase large subunit [Bacillota bacterium]